MKLFHTCIALLILFIAGCSTSEPIAVAPPPPSKVSPEVEAKVRACLNAMIDDISAIVADHPELVNFKPEIIKNGPHMLKSRPNILTSDNKESSFPPMGFSYSYNAVISRGKPPFFTTDGCLIRVKFFGADPGLKVGNVEFYRGQGVRGTWYCSGDDVTKLQPAIRKIVEKHAEMLGE